VPKKPQLIKTGLFGNNRNANNLSRSNKVQCVFIVGIEFVEGNTNLPLIRMNMANISRYFSFQRKYKKKSQGEIFDKFFVLSGPPVFSQ